MLRSLKFLAPAAFIVIIAQAYSQAPSNSSAAPSSATASSGTTIRTRAQLVVVDVVVTGRNGQAVLNLKPSDFTIFEDNVPQALRHFEAHAAPSAAQAAKLPAMPKMPPDIFTNYSPLPSASAVNVLLLDELNTPMKDQSYVRDQLLEYVKKAPPGTPIAIFALNDRLSLLQGFTSDPELLQTVVEKKGPVASRYLPDAVAGVDDNPDSVYDALTSMSGTDGPDVATLLASIQQFEAVQQSVQTQQRISQTLDAMSILARYLGGIPGRKNLIWFSGSFPLSILPDGDIKHPFAVVADAEDEFRETTRLLAYSQVAVYPIDAAGIMDASSSNASISGDKIGNQQQFSQNQAKFFEKTSNEQGTMTQMAESTGGQAFVNTNGLAEAVAQAIGNGSSYYTLAYTPSDPRTDGSYRKIEVKVQQPGLTLEYRRGYYTDDEKSGSSGHVSSEAAPAKIMNLTMLRGGPDPTQIVFKARILPSPVTSEDKPAPNNAVNTRLKNVKGPYRRYLVDIAADPGGVSFPPQPGGKYKGDLQALVFVYDQNGVLINRTGEEMHTNLPLDAYRQLFAHGIQFHEEVSVPLKGDYYLRIGLHDLNADRVGAVEVPVAAIRSPVPEPAAVK